MEDAATAEICRAQVWQWVRFGAKTNDGRTITAQLVKDTISEQVAKLTSPGRDLREASAILEALTTGEEFPEFLTLLAYDYLD
jgi:malate synthase